MKINTILKGTLILTAAGVISRLLGFFYRIFLTGIIGAEGLGLYQMVSVCALVCMAISNSGISVAISRYSALFAGKNKHNRSRHTLVLGMAVSFFISVLCSLVLYFFSSLLAEYVLKDARCALPLKIMAFMIPLSVIHNCVCSYYIGIGNAVIPAISQLLEQITRIGCVYLVFAVRQSSGLPVTVATGILGLVLGEFFSCLFCITACNFKKKDIIIQNASSLIKDIIKMAVPFSANRIILSILHSLEAILIPAMLRQYGLSVSESISTYGILSGMAFPLIMLPSTLVNSFSQMLLPAVSKASSGSTDSVRRTVHTAFEYSMIIGIFCLGAFIIWGDEAGMLLFNEISVGKYVTALAWMCPFLYISTTLSSILNGMGQTKTTLFLDVTSHMLRILIIIILIPRTGIIGFLLAFLISEIYLAVFCIINTNKLCPVEFDCLRWIIEPCISLAVSIGVCIGLHSYINDTFRSLPAIITLIISGGIMLLTYYFFMFILFAKKGLSPK